MKPYLNAVLKDVASRGKRKYDTIYIGGGTPSSVPYGILADFFNSLFDIVDNDFKESTIEGNPESIDENFLSVAEAYAFSRISIGCQSTDDEVLKKLTRIHGFSDIKNAVELTRTICPDSALNLDMIYDIPNCSTESVRKTADDLLSFQPEHISAYNYSFDTGFLSEYAQTETDYLGIKQRLEKAGYAKYEISNFALSGSESLHNLNYWKLGDYDGAGSSAWSLKNTPQKRILNGKISDITGYINAPLDFEETDCTEGHHRFTESLVFGLRMIEGVDVEFLAGKYCYDRKNYEEPVKKLINEGLLKWKFSKLLLTEKGELLLDSVQEFLWQHL
jgi:oxygen-independent coproporphyrinogen-3 oxidase